MARSKKKIHVLAYIICGMCIFFTVVITKQLYSAYLSHQSIEARICGNMIKTFLVEGNSMSPMIEDGSVVEGIMDYYTCDGNVPNQGDVVILEDSAVKGPYIKRIGAIPGDEISITENGSLIINNQELKNAHGEIYYFSQGELQFMSIYIRNGKLQNGAYLVFGDNTRNSRDSRKIGAISKDAFKAKVIKINDMVISE